jgi:hypothetical protein
MVQTPCIGQIAFQDMQGYITLYPSKVVHNYVVEHGWSGANKHYTR